MSNIHPSYGVIRDRLNQGKVIPFLGSGASLVERTPPAAAWRNPEGVPTYLPNGKELAGHLAAKAEFPNEENEGPPELAVAAQFYDVQNGRDPLNDELHSIFDRNYPFTILHEYLADVPVPLLIVTTNYDDLIEQAFVKKGRPYDLVIHNTDPGEDGQLLWRGHDTDELREVNPQTLDINLERVTVIYKMHGTVHRKTLNSKVDDQRPDRDQYVITEDDYIDFLGRMIQGKAIPRIFSEPFRNRHFLFLGYGLYDWNLRVMLSRIEKDMRRPSKSIKSWAIRLKPPKWEPQLWAQRDVNVFDMSIETFVKRLRGEDDSEGGTSEPGAVALEKPLDPSLLCAPCSRGLTQRTPP